MSESIKIKFLIEAIDRIARTPDGRSLYVYCQKRMMETCITSEASTLQRSEGERSFASHLRGLMETGILESGGRSTSTGSIDDEPVVFARPEPAPGRPHRGAGRRIDEHTRTGYDGPDFGPGSDAT